MRNSKGQFVPGSDASETSLPVGSIRLRTRKKRRNEQRQFIKVATPNVWVLLSQHVWESAHGPIPDRMGVHHKDRNKLNDDIGNLELVSKADHLAIHRPEFEARRIESVKRAATGRTWSTKSKAKLTGRPPQFDAEKMKAALSAYQAGEASMRDIAVRYGVKWNAIAHQVKKLRS